MVFEETILNAVVDGVNDKNNLDKQQEEIKDSNEFNQETEPIKTETSFDAVYGIDKEFWDIKFFNPKGFTSFVDDVVLFLSPELQAKKMAVTDKYFEMQKRRVSDHELKAEELNAIKQSQSKGFTIYDIDPKYFDSAYVSRTASVFPPGSQSPENPLGIPQEFIIEHLGTQLSQNVFGPVFFEDYVVNSLTPYLRTIEIDIVGNSLVFERIASPANAIVMGQASAQNLANTLASTGSQLFTGAALYQEADDFLDNVIFISFEDPNTKPFLVKHGDRFETYYTKIFITCKVGTPKFRIVSGLNSQYLPGAKGTDQLHLSYGGKNNILDTLNHSLYPFCVNQRDFVPNAQSVIVLAVPANGRIHMPFIIGPASGNLNGVGVVWITGIDLFVSAGSGSTTVIGDIGIRNANNPSFAVRKIHNFVSVVNSTTYTPFNVQFTTPVRCVLGNEEAICITFYAGGVAYTAALGFNIRGYSHGNFAPSFNVIGNNIRGPFYTNKVLASTEFTADKGGPYSVN